MDGVFKNDNSRSLSCRSLKSFGTGEWIKLTKWKDFCESENIKLSGRFPLAFIKKKSKYQEEKTRLNVHIDLRHMTCIEYPHNCQP